MKCRCYITKYGKYSLTGQTAAKGCLSGYDGKSVPLYKLSRLLLSRYKTYVCDAILHEVDDGLVAEFELPDTFAEVISTNQISLDICAKILSEDKDAKVLKKGELEYINFVELERVPETGCIEIIKEE